MNIINTNNKFFYYYINKLITNNKITKSFIFLQVIIMLKLMKILMMIFLSRGEDSRRNSKLIHI